jgi:hypothetical protein
MTEAELLKIIQDNFQRSMQANIEYHSGLAEIDQKDHDTLDATFHNLMAKMCKSFLK